MWFKDNLTQQQETERLWAVWIWGDFWRDVTTCDDIRPALAIEEDIEALKIHMLTVLWNSAKNLARDMSEYKWRIPQEFVNWMEEMSKSIEYILNLK